MTDLAMPAEKAGDTCPKCNGAGVYRWGTTTNGKAAREGICWSCKGKGRQTFRDIKRNDAYNTHKLVSIFGMDG